MSKSWFYKLEDSLRACVVHNVFFLLLEALDKFCLAHDSCLDKTQSLDLTNSIRLPVHINVVRNFKTGIMPAFSLIANHGLVGAEAIKWGEFFLAMVIDSFNEIIDQQPEIRLIAH